MMEERVRCGRRVHDARGVCEMPEECARCWRSVSGTAPEPVVIMHEIATCGNRTRNSRLSSQRPINYAIPMSKIFFWLSL